MDSWLIVDSGIFISRFNISGLDFFSIKPKELLQIPIIIFSFLIITSLNALLEKVDLLNVKGVKLEGKLTTLDIYVEFVFTESDGAKYLQSVLPPIIIWLTDNLLLALEITSAYFWTLNCDN